MSTPAPILIALLTLSGATAGLAQAPTNTDPVPRDDRLMVGGSGGLFGFLNGIYPGAAVHLTKTSDQGLWANLELWVVPGQPDGPVGAADMSILVGPPLAGGWVYLKLGGGFVASPVGSGPGAVLGLGTIIPLGAVGLRLDGSARVYTPGGGLPVWTLTIGFVKL